MHDSDLDVIIEIPEYDKAMVAEIDNIIFQLNCSPDEI
jgi:hypothetical protein